MSARQVVTIASVPGRPGHFRARLEGGGVLIGSSRQPFLDAARVRLADGCDPETVLVMRHAGSATESLRATVGAAARLTVEERETRPPRFVRWRPRDVTEGSPRTAIVPLAATGARTERPAAACEAAP